MNGNTNESERTRFIMIGGFLGAGKTTLIARLATELVDEGFRVGLVTNDQAYNLVDTHTLRAQGFEVGEVPGACFCCKFDELVGTLTQLAEHERPHFIITEPVGSCTDLVATVLEPLRQLHGERYEVAPLIVLCKPEHGKKILADSGQVGFSPQAAYIFLKQLEEADIVVVNKVDKLSAAQTAELVQLVERRFPGKNVVTASGLAGAGVAELRKLLSTRSARATVPMEVDYEIYAAGEAELGWLNATVDLRSNNARPFLLDNVVCELVDRLAMALCEVGAEPAHLKVLGQAGNNVCVANLVGSDTSPEQSITSGVQSNSATLLVNARVATDPEQLAQAVKREVQALAASAGLTAQISEVQQFRPAPPRPTHRSRVVTA